MPRVRMLPLLAVTLAASSVVGCGADDSPDATTGPPAATARHHDTHQPSPDQAADPATPTATAPATPSGRPSVQPDRHRGRHKVGVLQPRLRAAAAAHLLDAERLPMIGGRAWAVDATAPEDPARDPAVGACQKTPLGTIGAVEALRRTFTAAGGLTATQVVARFADSRSAWRAHEVLVAWRDDCEERLDLPHAEVGPLEPVTVRAGTAESYRAAYGPRSRARQRAAGLGILRTGSYLTVVEVTAGSDRYPDGWDPARVAVRRVARTF